MKRIIAAVCLTVLLAGCSAGSVNAPQEPSLLERQEAIWHDDTASEDTLTEETAAAADNPGRYLKFSTAPLPGGIERATAICSLEDRIVVGGLTREGAALAWTGADNTGGFFDLPADVEYVFALSQQDAGFVLLGGSEPAMHQDWRGSISGAETPEGRVWLARYDGNGVCTDAVELAQRYDALYMNFKQVAVYEDTYFLLSQQYLIQVNAAGQELRRMESEDGELYQAMALADGRLYVLAVPFLRNGGEITMFSFDPAAAAEITTQIIQAQEVSCFGPTADQQLLMNIRGNQMNALSAVDPELFSMDTIYEWDDISREIPYIMAEETPQGYLLFSPNDTELTQLLWVSGTKPEKIRLHMAVTGMSSISILVNGFNDAQDVYQIDMTTYNDDTIMETDLSLDILRTEVLAGQAPDLYCFSNLGTGSVFDGGMHMEKLTIDMLPLLNADSTYSQDMFIRSLMDSYVEEGEMHMLPLSFTIRTFLSPAALIPQAGITLEALEAVRAQAGADWVTFQSWMDAENLLSLSLPFYVSKFVDQDSAQCNFTAAEFADYLTWCKTWSGDGSVPDPSQRAILTMVQILSIDDLAYLGQNQPSTDYTYVGMPVEDGFGSAAFSSVEIGISNQTEHTEGAWAFIRYCLAHQGDQTQKSLPTLTRVLDDQLQELVNGEAVDWLGNPMQITQEEADRFKALLTQMTAVRNKDAAITAIIKEEAAFYFANSCTAAGAAEKIQNRVSLYLAENYG